MPSGENAKQQQRNAEKVKSNAIKLNCFDLVKRKNQMFASFVSLKNI